MFDIVVDTNVLADLLAQIFDDGSRISPTFRERDSISAELARVANKIVRLSSDPFIDAYPGQLVASTLAFVEISRKWDSIVQERFTVEQMAAFLEQPPEWFAVEPLDEIFVSALCDVPPRVTKSSGGVRSLEWTDAVHIATTYLRGDSAKLAVTDEAMQGVAALQGRVL